MIPIVQSCLNAFKAALQQIRPNIAVRNALQIDAGKQQLHMQGGRTYTLSSVDGGHPNVHLVAVGKAATGMVQGAECVLGDWLVDGIASVPTGAEIPPNLRTKFLTGAEHNLPDNAAMENAIAIEEFVRRVRGVDQLILFLISGGGSALLPSPVPGITLAEKCELISLMQNNGADIRQLNVVRTALSQLKGGGLARLGAPSKMIGLYISDIVGDPIELISSGPTVIPLASSSSAQQKDPIGILEELGIKAKVAQNVLNLLEQKKAEKQQQPHKGEGQMERVDVHNTIVASNSTMLETLADQLAVDGFMPVCVTNKLEGNATELGQAMGKLVARLLAAGRNAAVSELLLGKLLIELGLISAKEAEEEKKMAKLQQQIKTAFNEEKGNGTQQRLALLFGGESTVRFGAQNNGQGMAPKGGRNQELVLAAFRELLSAAGNDDGQQQNIVKEQWIKATKFALFSLGTDGQDGPTDAAGAYISTANIDKSSSTDPSSLLERVQLALETKCSYQFWHEFSGGQNLVKTGKTGVNVMDVQIVALEF